MTDLATLHGGDWYAEVPRSIRSQTVAGLLLVVLVFGGFSIWGFTAPLAAAVISQGSFVATGQNKIVQHLEGGIIEEILVGEGDRVESGQALVRLDRTAAEANYRQLHLRRVRLEALVARLQAQAHRADSVVWPQITQADGDQEVSDIIETQRLNFGAWTNKLTSDLGLLKQNATSLEHRAQGYSMQLKAMEQQLRLLQEEYEGKLSLLKQGLMRATEIKSIQRAIADAEGQSGRLVAEISENAAQVVKTRQQMGQVETTYVQAVLDELQKAEGELDSVREQWREAESVLRRSTIDAPVSGTVVRLHYHTSGGVIESGKAILEILPSDVPLIIETQVPRNQIDNVKLGQPATVRLVALSARTTPVLTGDVYYVSADSLASTPNGAKEVYLARVRIPGNELARIPHFHPTPGMPAEILIQTAERTFFDYLTKPVRDSMARAFMEK